MPPATSGSSIVTEPVAAWPASAPRSCSRVSGSIRIPASRPPRASGGSGVAERHAREPARSALDLGEEPDRPARHAGSQRVAEAGAVASRLRLDARRELARGRRPLALAPAVQLQERARRQAQQRDPALPLQPADPAGQAQHRLDVGVGQRPEAAQRRRILDRDQPAQVLADDVVERHAMRSLVALAARQRRAVALGEQRQPEADDQEGGRGDGVAGTAGEAERGDPEPE